MHGTWRNRLRASRKVSNRSHASTASGIAVLHPLLGRNPAPPKPPLAKRYHGHPAGHDVRPTAAIVWVHPDVVAEVTYSELTQGRLRDPLLRDVALRRGVRLGPQELDGVSHPDCGWCVAGLR